MQSNAKDVREAGSEPYEQETGEQKRETRRGKQEGKKSGARLL